MIPISQNTNRLLYIDGIRGLIAVWIVATHCYWEVFTDGGRGTISPYLAGLLQPVAFANKVAIFIVISGYCLFLPLIRAQRPVLSGGIFAFIQRRIKRILLPYYTVLALSLLLIALVPVLQRSQGVRWDVALPAFTSEVIVSHLLLLHNLSPEWLVRINPPLWSLAVEWQIYFVFLFVLLPLWRQLGITTSLLTGFVLGLLPHYLLPVGANFDWTAPWYLSLFCLGAAAASVLHHPIQIRRISLSGTLFFGFVVLITMNTRLLWLPQDGAWRLGIDMIVGLFTACFLMYGTSALLSNERPWAIRFLENGLFQRLGRYSYSIYLVHFPLLSLLHSAIRSFLPNNEAYPLWRLSLLFLLGIPLSLFASFLFAKIFNRRSDKPVDLRSKRALSAIER